MLVTTCPFRTRRKARLTFAICACTPLAFRDATAFCAAAGLSKSTKPYPTHTHKDKSQLFIHVTTHTNTFLRVCQKWRIYYQTLIRRLSDFTCVGQNKTARLFVLSCGSWGHKRMCMLEHGRLCLCVSVCAWGDRKQPFCSRLSLSSISSVTGQRKI